MDQKKASLAKKAFFVLMPLVTMMGLTQFVAAQQTTPDWTITINPINVPTNVQKIYFDVKSLSTGADQYQWIYYNNGWPSASVTLAGVQFPLGQDYQICAAADTLIGTATPCQYV